MSIGAFGESFPYSNFHDLNMDWIISIIKDFKDNYPNVIEELNAKLNKPLINPDGTLNSVLVSNGDGTTRWDDIEVVYYDLIARAVDEWLTEHPEATTTVEDRSITMDKLTYYMQFVVKRNAGNCIAPVYIGDYLISSNYLPSCAIYMADHFVYMLNGVTREYGVSSESGTGYIVHGDLADNILYPNRITATLGHANSICYNGNFFYVCPVWEYSSEGETRVSKIYEMNSDFTIRREIITPVSFVGVSYDAVTGEMYAYQPNTGRIYKFNTTTQEFELFTTVNGLFEADNTWYPENIILRTRSFNQDLAVYNNEFYISSPHGNILHGYLEEIVSEVKDFFYVTNTDSTGTFNMGELEGFEFRNGGHLYGLMYSNLPEGTRNAFFVEIPVGHANPTSPTMTGLWSMEQSTSYLNNSTKNKFYLTASELRSLQQLNLRNNKYHASTVEISGSVDEEEQTYSTGIIHVNDNLTLNISSEYSLCRFIVRNGILNIYPSSNSNLLNFSTDEEHACFELARNGHLILSGTNALRVSRTVAGDAGSDNFITAYQYGSIVEITRAVTEINGNTLTYGTEPILHDEVYVNGKRTLWLPTTYKAFGGEGCMDNSAKKIYLYFNTPRKVSEVTGVTGKLYVAGVNGWVESSNGIDLSSADYVVSARMLDAFFIELTVTKANGSAFTNATDGTSITNSGGVTFTLT